MTAVTALEARARPGSDAALAPVPWHQMGWVTWRQHRAALGGVATFLGVLALYMWITGLQLHHAYAAAIACHPASAPACGEPVSNFNDIGNFLADGFLLQVVPGLIGAFLGAPLLARELETGTFRYAWTQGFGRVRWTLAKLVMLGVAVLAVGGAVGALLSWYYQPYFGAGNQRLSLTQWPSLAPGLFPIRGVAFASWALAAFAIGCLAGTLIRRAVPAIVATLVVYLAIAFAAGDFLRARYLAPVVTHSLNLPSTAWTLSQRWFKGGHIVSTSVLGQVLQNGAPQVAGKGGVPQSLTAWQYLVQHGFTQLTTYQPASRFWPFQWIEGGWLLALSVVCISATVMAVRRRAV